MPIKTVTDSLTQIKHAHAHSQRTENFPHTNQENNFKNELTSEEIKDIWSQILDKLSSLVKKTSIKTWIKPCKVIAINSEEIVIAVKNEFTRKFIMQSFSESIYQASKEVLAASIKLRLVVDHETAEETSKEKTLFVEKPDINVSKSQPKKLSSLLEKSDKYETVEQKTFADIPSPKAKSQKNLKIDPYTGLYTQYKFENLVISKSNISVVTFAKAIIEENMGFHYSSLFIRSDVGLGKTHILNAVAHEALSNDPLLKVKYIKAEDFLNEYVISLKNKSYEKFKKNLEI